MITLRQLPGGAYEITGIPRLGERINVIERSPTDGAPLPATTAIVHGWKPSGDRFHVTYWPWGVQGMSSARAKLLDGADDVGRLSEGDRLRRQLEAHGKQAERAHARGLRSQIATAKLERRQGLQAARAMCKADEDRNRKDALELRARKERDRVRCSNAKQAVQTAAAARIDPARAELAEAVERRQLERRWAGERSAAPRASRRELAAESDDRVRSELPPELQPVWDRHKRRFAEGTPHDRLERFNEWAAEHRADVEAEIERDLDRSIDRILATEEAYYSEREPEAAEGIQVSDHYVTIEPDPSKPGSFMVRNQRGHRFLSQASLESARATARDKAAVYRYEIHDHSGQEDPRGPGAVLLEWGAAPNKRGPGWLPQLWENGRQRLDEWHPRGFDTEADALEEGRRIARERLDRYSGDWMITLRPRAKG